MRKKLLLSLFYLIGFLLGGCTVTPSVGVLELNGNLPIIAESDLRLGVTVNNGTGERDLLAENLLLNGNFDLAPLLEHCSYSERTRQLTTPNGYSLFYPRVSNGYGWSVSEGEIQFQEDEHQNGSVLFSPQLKAPSILHASKSPLPLHRSEELEITAELSGINVEVELSLISDTITKRPVSKIEILRPNTRINRWEKIRKKLIGITEADSSYLQIKVSKIDSLGGSFLKLDNVSIHKSKTDLHKSLQYHLSLLSPHFLRYPEGRIANGYFAGSYPQHSCIRKLPLPIWTINKSEYTGLFTLYDFIRLSKEVGAQPILIENSGITSRSALSRIESSKKASEIVTYLSHLFKQWKDDSLLIQLGYKMEGAEYVNRFKEIETGLKKSGFLSPHLIAAGWLANEQKKEYSDYINDFALPPLKSPDFTQYLSPSSLNLFYQHQPLMLGEVHFASPTMQERFMPRFLLRAAFLIELEKYAYLFQGTSISPLISEDPHKEPILLFRNNEFFPTTLYYYLRFFKLYTGEVLRSIPATGGNSRAKGLYVSLTSDKKGTEFFLKVANTTRHPLTYTLQLEGENLKQRFLHIVHFSPKASVTTSQADKLNEYIIFTSTQKLGKRASKITHTFNPYEVLLMHFSPKKRAI